MFLVFIKEIGCLQSIGLLLSEQSPYLTITLPIINGCIVQ